MSGLKRVGDGQVGASVTANAASPGAASGLFDSVLIKAQSATNVHAEFDTPPPTTAERDTQLQWAASQLEAYFLKEMLTAMRRTVPEGGVFPQSFSMKTYQEMQDAEHAKAMAAAGGIGLADVILRQMRG